MLKLKTALTQVASWKKATKDYVVEQGTGYRKWNSGILEQWGTVTTGTSSGTKQVTITFPVEFKDASFNVLCTPRRNANTVNNGVADCNTAGNVTHTTKTAVVTAFANTSSSVSVGIFWYARGTWK